MKPEDKELYNEKLDRLEKETDFKVAKLGGEARAERDQIRNLLVDQILPELLEIKKDVKEAKMNTAKTNGRVTKLEDAHNNYISIFNEFKKKVDKNLSTLFHETDMARVIFRYPKITTAFLIVGYIGLLFNDEVIQLFFNIF